MNYVEWWNLIPRWISIYLCQRGIDLSLNLTDYYCCFTETLYMLISKSNDKRQHDIRNDVVHPISCPACCCCPLNSDYHPMIPMDKLRYLSHCLRFDSSTKPIRYAKLYLDLRFLFVLAQNADTINRKSKKNSLEMLNSDICFG